MRPVPLPQAIERASDHDIRIRWKDGHQGVYLARALRLACPCAGCVEEMTGKPLLDDSRVPEGVYPEAIGLVGHYAISIRWSDGHATGIYSYEFLRRICPCNECR